MNSWVCMNLFITVPEPVLCMSSRMMGIRGLFHFAFMNGGLFRTYPFERWHFMNFDYPLEPWSFMNADFIFMISVPNAISPLLVMT